MATFSFEHYHKECLFFFAALTLFFSLVNLTSLFSKTVQLDVHRWQWNGTFLFHHHHDGRYSKKKIAR